MDFHAAGLQLGIRACATVNGPLLHRLKVLHTSVDGFSFRVCMQRMLEHCGANMAVPPEALLGLKRETFALLLIGLWYLGCRTMRLTGAAAWMPGAPTVALTARCRCLHQRPPVGVTWLPTAEISLCRSCSFGGRVVVTPGNLVPWVFVLRHTSSPVCFFRRSAALW